VDTSSRAIVTATRFTDATKAEALPNKLAGIIFRLRNEEGYLGYAIRAKNKRLTCRDLGGFDTEPAAKQAIADEFAKREVRPPVK
jgi:hypothetical protein